MSLLLVVVSQSICICDSPIFNEDSGDFSDVPFYHATASTIRKMVGQGDFAGISLTTKYEDATYLGVECIKQSVTFSQGDLGLTTTYRAKDVNGDVYILWSSFNGEIVFAAQSLDDLVPDDEADSFLVGTEFEFLSYDAVLPQFFGMKFKKVGATIDGFQYFYYYHESVGPVLTVVNESGDVNGHGFILKDFPSVVGVDIEVIGLNFLDVGNYWQYEFTTSIVNNVPATNVVIQDYQIVKNQLINGYDASVLKISSDFGSNELFWALSEDRIISVASNSNFGNLHKIVQNDDVYEFWPRYVNTLDYKKHIGHGKFFVTQDDIALNWTETYDSYLTYLGEESVTVALGTFECQNILIREDWFDSDEFWGYTEETLWFTPEIGIIKAHREDYSWDAFNSIGSKDEGSYELLYTNIDIGFSGNYDDIVLTKVTAKAGKKRYLNSDTLSIKGVSLNCTETVFRQAQFIYIDLYGDESDIPIVSEDLIISYGKLKRDKFSYKGYTGGVTALNIDLKRGVFSLTAKGVNLKGLSNTITAEIIIGTYGGAGTGYDSGPEGALPSGAHVDIMNDKKVMPLQFMSGYKDVLIIDKLKLNIGKKPSTDLLIVKGKIALLNHNVNLANKDIDLIYGDYSVPLSASDLYQLGSKRVYKYKKPRGSNSSIAVAIFDLDKCTFKIALKKADIGIQGDEAKFEIQFDGFMDNSN